MTGALYTVECVGSTRLLCLLFLREKCLRAREPQLKSYSVCAGVFRRRLEYCWFSTLLLCSLSAFLVCVCVCWVFIDLLYNSLGSWCVRQESLCYCLEQPCGVHAHLADFPYPRQSSTSQKVLCFIYSRKEKSSKLWGRPVTRPDQTKLQSTYSHSAYIQLTSAQEWPTPFKVLSSYYYLFSSQNKVRVSSCGHWALLLRESCSPDRQNYFHWHLLVPKF